MPESTVPASMGGPLSEAELFEAVGRRSLDEIRAYLAGGPRPSHGTDADRMAWLLDRVDRLQERLDTAQGQLAPFTAQHRPSKNMFRTCVTCRDGYGEPLPWPCRDAKRLGLATTCPACSDWVLRDGDAKCPSCDADLTAKALGLDGGDPDGS